MKERKNLIDGLPNSYDVNYVITTKKSCELCNKLILTKQISNNAIVCTESFEFFHKTCLENKGITYNHYNPKDKSTPITLDKSIVK